MWSYKWKVLYIVDCPKQYWQMLSIGPEMFCHWMSRIMVLILDLYLAYSCYTYTKCNRETVWMLSLIETNWKATIVGWMDVVSCFLMFGSDNGAWRSYELYHILVWICCPLAFVTGACMTYDRGTLINIREGGAENGLNAADLETINAHGIFWVQPLSQTCIFFCILSKQMLFSTGLSRLFLTNLPVKTNQAYVYRVYAWILIPSKVLTEIICAK